MTTAKPDHSESARHQPAQVSMHHDRKTSAPTRPTLKQLLAHPSQPDAQAAAKPTLDLPPLRHTAPVLLFFALLPYLLPESDVLARTALIQWLAGYIPSAAKIASISAYPNVVFVHVVLMLAVVPVLAIVWAQSIPYRLLYQAAIPRTLLRRLLVLIYVAFAMLFCISLVALFYFLPGGAFGVPEISRGGLALAAITKSKFGLGTVGVAAGFGVFALLQGILFLAIGAAFALIKPLSSKGSY